MGNRDKRGKEKKKPKKTESKPPVSRPSRSILDYKPSAPAAPAPTPSPATPGGNKP